MYIRQLLIGVFAMTAMSEAVGQAYPSKPIEVVVAQTPGTGPDIIGRLVSDALSRGGLNAFVVNKPGAAGVVGAQDIARSAADGYHISSITTGPLILNRFLFRELAYEPEKFTLIYSIGFVPMLVVVRPDLPVNNIKELAEYSKGQSLFYGTTNTRNIPHIVGEAIVTMGGVRMTHVPYKGIGQGFGDLKEGRLQVLIDAPPALENYVGLGVLKAIAVTSASRTRQWPNVPTVAESIPGFVADSWYVVVGPQGMPQEVVKRLHGTLREYMGSSETHLRLDRMGFTSLDGGDLSSIRGVYEHHKEQWTKLMQSTSLQPE